VGRDDGRKCNGVGTDLVPVVDDDGRRRRINFEELAFMH
jgi:hypothetical protein